MTDVFLDTNALVGLYVARDQHHKAARRELEALREERNTLITSTDVFDETVTLLRKYSGVSAAVSAGDDLRDSPEIDLVEVDAACRETAWGIFRKTRDQDLSLTDCTSIALMNRYGVRRIFTFDAAFRRLGFRILPE